MMEERNWQCVVDLGHYLDELFRRLELHWRPGVVPKNMRNVRPESIRVLKRAEILKMSADPNAVEEMISERVSYSAFVVVAFLLGTEEDFKCSLKLLEKTADGITDDHLMPKRPKFLEEILAA